MVHRFLAAIIGLTILVFWLVVRREEAPLRFLSSSWLLLVIVQITLGAWTIWSNKAADIATAHVAVGAITFSAGVAISAILLRFQEAPFPARHAMGFAEAKVA
jgi:cytochrome c oxidase assembly protein subunit 15